MYYRREIAGGPLERPFHECSTVEVIGGGSIMLRPARPLFMLRERLPLPARVVFSRWAPADGWFDLYLAWYGTPSARTLALRGPCSECGERRCSCNDARDTDHHFRTAVREGWW